MDVQYYDDVWAFMLRCVNSDYIMSTVEGDVIEKHYCRLENICGEIKFGARKSIRKVVYNYRTGATEESSTSTKSLSNASIARYASDEDDLEDFKRVYKHINNIDGYRNIVRETKVYRRYDETGVLCFEHTEQNLIVLR